MAGSIQDLPGGIFEGQGCPVLEIVIELGFDLERGSEMGGEVCAGIGQSGLLFVGQVEFGFGEAFLDVVDSGDVIGVLSGPGARV